MPIFRFYPADFARQYAVAEDQAALSAQADRIFSDFVSSAYAWLDTSDPDEMDYLRELRERFDIGLQGAERAELTFTDTNY